MTAILLDGHKAIVIGRDHILIESRTRPDQWHALELVDEGKGYLVEHCTCEAYTHRHPDQEIPCWHCRLVRSWRVGRIDARLDLEAVTT